MVDSFGRTIDYLRISITERCNLRCLYCMPPEGVAWIPHDKVLRFEEIFVICRIFAGLGISDIKISGGEPLVRRGAVDFIRELNNIIGINRVSMTSNGILLGEYLQSLSDAGLKAINISLDTLNEETYRRLTGLDGGLSKVLSAINKALELELEIKINCVPLAEFNKHDIVHIAGMAKNRNITVRFIELMPLGAAADLEPIPADQVFSLIEKTYGKLKLSPLKFGKGPAVYYQLEGFKGHIGFINAISHNFCHNCNRLRLSSSGNVKLCLGDEQNLDLGSLVRSGISEEKIAAAIEEFIINKPSRHSFGGVNVLDQFRKQEMFRIGG